MACQTGTFICSVSDYPVIFQKQYSPFLNKGTCCVYSHVKHSAELTLLQLLTRMHTLPKPARELLSIVQVPVLERTNHCHTWDLGPLCFTLEDCRLADSSMTLPGMRQTQQEAEEREGRSSGTLFEPANRLQLGLFTYVNQGIHLVLYLYFFQNPNTLKEGAENIPKPVRCTLLIHQLVEYSWQTNACRIRLENCPKPLWQLDWKIKKRSAEVANTLLPIIDQDLRPAGDLTLYPRYCPHKSRHRHGCPPGDGPQSKAIQRLAWVAQDSVPGKWSIHGTLYPENRLFWGNVF